MEDVELLFDNQKEVLSIIKNGGSIIKLFGYPSEKCFLIGSHIKLIEKIGSGATGTIFSIDVPEMGKRKFVVKKQRIYLDTIFMTAKQLEQDLIKHNLDWEDFKIFQSEDVIQEYEKKTNKTLIINSPPKDCLLTKDYSFTAIPGNKEGEQITIKKGAYLCKEKLFSEYPISVYVGTLYRNGNCINFINTYAMIMCPETYGKRGIYTKQFFEYIFMDRVDNQLYDFQKCLKIGDSNFIEKETLIENIYIQVMFAISAYQHYFKISHNDLSVDNILIDNVRSDTIFNDQIFSDADWYHYEFMGKNIYIPAIGMIAKIVDFGIAIKYSDPVIGSVDVFTTGLDLGAGPNIPNKFIPAKDSLYFSLKYAEFVDKYMSREKLGDLLSDCLVYICGFDKSNKFVKNILKSKLVMGDSYVPNIFELGKIKSAIEVLDGPIYEKYHKKPKQGKIVTLGTL